MKGQQRQQKLKTVKGNDRKKLANDFQAAQDYCMKILPILVGVFVLLFVFVSYKINDST